MIFDNRDKKKLLHEKRMREDEDYAIKYLCLVQACNKVNEILEKLNDYGHLVDVDEFLW